MSNKKNCLLYGNCQIITHVYNLLKNNTDFTDSYNIYNYVNHYQTEIIKLNIPINIIQNVDIFIYQPLNDNHGCYSTNYLCQLLKNTCIKISIPYIYNSALYTVFYENATLRWRKNVLVNCGFKNILILMKNNTSLEQILNMYDNDKLDFYFKDRFKICIDSLKIKESICTIQVSDFIIKHHLTKRLFITQNHLTNFFYIWIVKSIFEFLENNYNLKYTYKFNETDDNNIESNCVFDKYNLKEYNFNYSILNSDDKTKEKIKLFYKNFINEIDNINIEELDFYEIKNNEPEKFINHNL